METRQEVSFDLLRKYGSKWAILAAMRIDFKKRGIQLPDDIDSTLKTIRIEITSGCYSTCEIDCSLNKVEGQMISSGASLGEDYLNPWTDLLAKSMKGELDYETILEIPALEPVKSSCGFLKCSC